MNKEQWGDCHGNRQSKSNKLKARARERKSAKNISRSINEETFERDHYRTNLYSAESEALIRTSEGR